MTKSRGIIIRKPWTGWQDALMRKLFPNTRTAEVAVTVGHTYSATAQRARHLGLRKSRQFNESSASGRTGHDKRGLSGQFKPGHPSWNKGTHWTAGGRSAETRFTTGQLPHNTVPVGSYRVTKDGYLERKYAERPGGPSKRWRSVHRLLWEAANGEVPSDHVIVFKAGQRTVVLQEITLDRLELVSRVELMKRNTLHRYPKDVALAIQMRGALIRQINKRRKRREDEDQRPA